MGDTINQTPSGATVEIDNEYVAITIDKLRVVVKEEVEGVVVDIFDDTKDDGELLNSMYTFFSEAGDE